MLPGDGARGPSAQLDEPFRSSAPRNNFAILRRSSAECKARRSPPRIGPPSKGHRRTWHVGQVELDRAMATRLEVNEQQPLVRAEDVPRVRLAVKQLFGRAAVADRPSHAS
jgi:hypothetical protein